MQSSLLAIITLLVFTAIWVAIVALVFVFRHRQPQAGRFWEEMIVGWPAAFGISVLYLVSNVIGGGIAYRTALGFIAIFCQALIGLALARQISGFDPLPVVYSITNRERVGRNLLLLAGLSILFVPVGLLLSQIGSGVGSSIFGETSPDIDLSLLPKNLWSAFFAFLAGSGIAEEAIFRLLLLSLLWRWTRRRWLSISVAALAFGLYHLTPLNRMYEFFWHIPISQVLSATLGGLVSGYLYTRRGYETAVLEHTLENGIPFALFTLFSK